MLLWSRLIFLPGIPFISVFSFLFLIFNFVVCKNFVKFFHLLSIFFLKITLLKRISPISSNFLCSHSAKIHQEKSLLCAEFILFFNSGFICYDRPCNFSFFPQAVPIIATGQGEPAPTLVHSPSWGRRLRGCIYRFRDSDFVLRASPSQDCKQLLYVTIEQCLIITVPTHNRHKIPFKHSTTIYVFTSGPLIITACPNT